ncbi:hypothetical protein [Ornithinimicrobium sp. W1665]
MHPGTDGLRPTWARLPDAEFVVVPDAGHAFSEPGTLDVLVRTTDRFADG